ncbi:hypothetical protein AS156_29360 [Bradyrhizobium macuxiense]|uniref:Uncharacterized protein n=2 Tax=Bradyrhizobium macuxiense TaxID=1755647 RepID=A0A109K4L4_9BRAD|nr:hypothetical protein AS156_29360 [Bradyrhizobium macuxiense]
MVAASSAYPAFFPPLSLDHTDVGAPEGSFQQGNYFTDAGIFDNLGLYGLKEGASGQLSNIYVSDAGRSFVPQQVAEFGILRTALRAVDIFMFRIRLFDLAASAATPSTKVISISDQTNVSGASPIAIQAQLQNVRTDLDKFSELEIRELIRHGYYLTAKVLASEKGLPAPPLIPGWDIPADAPIAAQREFARKLQRSSVRKWRLFSVRDWVSGMQLLVLAALLGAALALSGPIAAQLDRIRGGLQAASLRDKPPEWTEPPHISVEVVDKLTQPTNEGFDITSDSRVWDLRQLKRSGNSPNIVGPLLLTRLSTLARRDASATQYKYLYRTAASQFVAWSPGQVDGVRLLRSTPPADGGLNVLTSYELQLDVTQHPLNEKFVLKAQARTVDAPWDRNNTWLGMRITDDTASASMRIIFPKDLPYKRPVFLSYPNDSALPAPSTDGIVLNQTAEKELIWRVEHPKRNWTYRIQWDWE